tara:strand:+ start:18 stop:434 length:417 start_codon:yes stop_codon:yes gene_type:complete
MKENLQFVQSLRNKCFYEIDIEQILNYLETLDYELDKTIYLGMTSSKNERLAKYFFLRDQFNFQKNFSDKSIHINEILDQCIDWREFWRLLVIKKGFCCIRLSGVLSNSFRYVFLSGPNILSGPFAEVSHSIHDDLDL